MKYLKDNQYYIDLYDLQTIRECLTMREINKDVYIQMKKKYKNDKKITPAEMAKGSNWAYNQHLFVIIGNRYRNKEETIREWILQDQEKENKYNNTPTPKNIKCPACKKLMKVRNKYLEILEKPLKLVFIFECPSCKKRLKVNEDGTIRESTPLTCPKCKGEANLSLVKEGKSKVIWKTSCASCGFEEISVDDFKKMQRQRREDEKFYKMVLDECRERFCSDKQGQYALEYIDSIPVANEVFEEEVEKFDSQAYQQTASLKKMNIIEIENLLSPIFEKDHYINLSFEKPEIGQYITLQFSVLDADDTRKKNDSSTDLKKLLSDALEGTNWRLMSDGISYRLGFLSGRLRGYENDDELFELNEHKETPKKQSKIDPETRAKYENYHLIQLAKAMGEMKGIENVRKRRLKNEPEGFFLGENEGPLKCNICNENYPGNQIWWNLEGLRCEDCMRNIKEGTIPPLGQKDRLENAYFENWQLSSNSYFNIRPATARKLRREGILHGHDLKRKDGTIYQTLYLYSENKEFLSKYPVKKGTPMKLIDLMGNTVEIY